MVVFKVLRHAVTLILFVLPLQILGFPVLAVYLLFKARDFRIASSKLAQQRLPNWLSIWDVGDDKDRKYGLNGDLGYQTYELLESTSALPESTLNNAIELIYDPEDVGKWVPWWRIWWLRYKWLAIRNPISSLKWKVLGIDTHNVESKVTKGNIKALTSRGWKTYFYFESDYSDIPIFIPPLPEVGDWHFPGKVYQELYIKGHNKLYWEYYLIKMLPKWTWSKKGPKCIRIRLGYKLGHRGNSVRIRKNVAWVFVVQPYKTYRGRLKFD